MDILNTSKQSDELNAESSQTRATFDSRRQIMYLLVGLERQKEELGPIADELISLLKRLGVTASALPETPQAGSHS